MSHETGAEDPNLRSVVHNYSHLIMFLHDVASEERNHAGNRSNGISGMLSTFHIDFTFRLLAFVF